MPFGRSASTRVVAATGGGSARLVKPGDGRADTSAVADSTAAATAVSRPPAESRLRDERYAAVVGSELPAVTGLLAALFAVVAAIHPFMLTGTPRVVMTIMASVTSLGFLALCAWVCRHPMGGTTALLTISGVCVVVAANAITQMYIAKRPFETSSVLLIITGTGVVVLALRWFVATIALVTIGWFVAFQSLAVAERQHWFAAVVLALLLSSSTNQVRRRGIDRLAEALEAAERAAVEDGLTGLLNRRGLVLVGEQIVATARRAGNAVHCLFIDVDGLKEVNDRQGHSAGDMVLVAVADALRQSVRAGDVVARWGGDEFAVIGPGPGTAPIDMELRIAGRVSELPPEGVHDWQPLVSVGSAMLTPWDDGDMSSLLDAADREMYRRRALRRTLNPPTGAKPAPADAQD